MREPSRASRPVAGPGLVSGPGAPRKAPQGAQRPRRALGAVTAVNGVAVALLLAWDGTPAWRVVRALVAGAVTVAALRIETRGTPRQAGLVAVALGLVGLVVGIGIGVRHVTVAGVTAEALLGLAALAAGVVLLVAGSGLVLRGVRGWRRVPAVAGAVLGVALVAFVCVPPVLATNVPPTGLGDARPADVGLSAEDVRFTTADGVRIAAWYVPSTNGAAVVLRHGAGSTRTSALAQAAVLARAGYGVLLTDARGHGESGGRAMDFGWYGDLDVAAAVSYLAGRPDVDPDRIGAVGLSMGGEEVIGAAAADPRVRAVVAEGALARTAADKDWFSDAYGFRGWIQEQLERVQDLLTDLLTAAPEPTPLAEAVRAAAPRPFLLIAAGDVEEEQEAADVLRSVSPATVRTWVVPGAAHTDGLDVAPDEWRARVVGFLDGALG